jgi:hypothetical protein
MLGRRDDHVRPLNHHDLSKDLSLAEQAGRVLPSTVNVVVGHSGQLFHLPAV